MKLEMNQIYCISYILMTRHKLVAGTCTNTTCPQLNYVMGILKQAYELYCVHLLLADVDFYTPVFILDVKIEITGTATEAIDQLIFSTNDSIEFVAHVQSPPCGSEVYLWSWGTQSGQKRRTLTNRMTQMFSKYDR